MRHFIIYILLSLYSILSAQVHVDLVVAKDGSGDCTTIQAAIDQVPLSNSERILIHIKPGIYEEKLYIERDCITLTGQEPGSVIIKSSLLRKEFRKTNPDDWGASVINIKASDLVLKNLIVRNTYGELHDEHDHQFTVRLMKGTRIIFDNCSFYSGGGDTISLWDKKMGMYYHRNCHFQGYVDFVCPRGWCYITGSTFYESKKTAAVWHDGSKAESQKLVIVDSTFDGVKGFKLGRRHYDAQFYFINCGFSRRMADIPVYRKTYPDKPEKNRPNLYGDRYYFDNCSKKGKKFDWIQDNLDTHKDRIQTDRITAAWTFENKWDPELVVGLSPLSIDIMGSKIVLSFGEPMTVRGKPELELFSGLNGIYREGSGSNKLVFDLSETPVADDKIKGLRKDTGEIFSSLASLETRETVFPVTE